MGMLLELCSLCPIEPACKRQPMIEHLRPGKVGGQTSAGGTAAFRIAGQPYRCWMLSLIEVDARPKA